VTAPARVKEADMMRAVRTAKKLGAKRVRIAPDGSIDIVLDDGRQERLASLLAPPEPASEEVKTLW
jgi:hypothetical protein